MNELALPESRSSGLRELALFAGAGGGILGSMLHGWRTVAAVEIEDYPRRVLLERQSFGILPRFPIWDDVCTFDGEPWRGKIDVISGGFPCTNISVARTNSRDNGTIEGLDGAASGLWREYKRIIGEVRPGFAWIENSPNLRTNGLVRILKDLALLGYHARWCVLGSGDIEADHERKRIWILAHAHKPQFQGGSLPSGVHSENPYLVGADWREDQSRLERVANGVATGLDPNWGRRLKAIGNGQDPRVCALAWEILSEGLI